MSCNEIIDSRITSKTNMPAYIGDFWLSQGSEEAKKIVRLFSRTHHGSSAWDYTDYLQNLLTPGKCLINTLPFNIDFKESDLGYINFNPSNYRTNLLDNVDGTDEVAMRHANSYLSGIYGTDSETGMIWQHPDGRFLIWNINLHPDEEDSENLLFAADQPQFTIPYADKVPTVILSKRGYLIYGLDFTAEEGLLRFTAPLFELFDSHIPATAGYEKRKTLLSFPFSVDPEVGAVDQIAKFLRQNNSVENLRLALNQVTGYTYTPDLHVVRTVGIPEGTVLLGINGETFVVSQDTTQTGTLEAGTFPGNPVTVLQGSSAGTAALIGPKTKFKVRTQAGILELTDTELMCTVNPGLVTIHFPDTSIADYINSARMVYEALNRYDELGNLIQTFSEYLKDKYAPSAALGDTFEVNILREYLTFYGDNIIVVLFNEALTEQQIQAGIDFLQTHTPTNAIIMYDTLWV